MNARFARIAAAAAVTSVALVGAGAAGAASANAASPEQNAMASVSQSPNEVPREWQVLKISNVTDYTIRVDANWNQSRWESSKTLLPGQSWEFMPYDGDTGAEYTFRVTADRDNHVTLRLSYGPGWQNLEQSNCEGIKATHFQPYEPNAWLFINYKNNPR